MAWYDDPKGGLPDGPPAEAWGKDPAEPAAAVAIGAVGALGLVAYLFTGPVGVLIVGMLGTIATLRNELYDERAETTPYDEPRMMAIDARARRQRQRLGTGERLAENQERTDRLRTIQVVRAVFWAQVMLGLYLVVS